MLLVIIILPQQIPYLTMSTYLMKANLIDFSVNAISPLPSWSADSEFPEYILVFKYTPQSDDNSSIKNWLLSLC